jgi:hypothetical protein
MLRKSTFEGRMVFTKVPFCFYKNFPQIFPHLVNNTVYTILYKQAK